MAKKHPFDRLIEASLTALGERYLKSAVEDFALDHGFEFYAYLHIRAKRCLAVSNYPSEWQGHYLERSYSRIDPVITAAKRGLRAFCWSLEGGRSNMEGDLRRFHEEAAEFNIRAGFSIPVRTGFGQFAVLTLASSRATSLENARNMDVVQAAAAAAMIHAAFSRRGKVGGNPALVALNESEIMCLRWAAEGKSMAEIAQLAGIKYNTVRFYIDAAKEKLEAVTLQQATALATRLMLI
jgi:LuxR family transcriptional activator of conjugal transfer of Ti plasmids